MVVAFYLFGFGTWLFVQLFLVSTFFNVPLMGRNGAVDVAFTEATVGAGASTVVLIATIFNIKEKRRISETAGFNFSSFDRFAFSVGKISRGGETRNLPHPPRRYLPIS